MEFFVFLIFAFVLVGIVKSGQRVRRRQRRIGDMVDDVFDEAFEGARGRRGRGRHRDEPPPPPPVVPQRPAPRRPAPRRGKPAAQAPLDFRCNHCGAQQNGPMDLSPSGDVKCAFCGNWFNVRT